MVQVCSVVGCVARRTKDSGRSFHRFPKENKPTYQKWLDFVARIKENGEDWVPTINSRVCSHHFVPDDYKEFTVVKVLKPTAFPTQFPYLPKEKEPDVTPRRSSPRNHPVPVKDSQKNDKIIMTRKQKLAISLWEDSKKNLKRPSCKKLPTKKVLKVKDSSKSVSRRFRKIARPKSMRDSQQKSHHMAPKDSSSLEDSREGTSRGSHKPAGNKPLEDSHQNASLVSSINSSHSKDTLGDTNFISSENPSPHGESAKNVAPPSTKLKLDHGYACPSMENELQLMKNELNGVKKRLAAKQMEAKALSQKIKRRDDMIAMLLAQLKGQQIANKTGKDDDISKVDFRADTETIMLIESYSNKDEVNESCKNDVKSSFGYEILQGVNS